jgi:hypothetical protein
MLNAKFVITNFVINAEGKNVEQAHALEDENLYICSFYRFIVQDSSQNI